MTPGTLPDFLPEIAGIGFGAVLAIVLELLKPLGLHEQRIPLVVLLAGALWSALAIGMDLYPEAAPWIVYALRAFLTLAAVPVASRVTYQNMVRPVTKKRWNKDRDWHIIE